MKMISLWQPWASLMAIGKKHNETRSWSTPYRGHLVVHAAKKRDKESLALCEVEPFRSALASAGITNAAQLPFGAILSIHNLTDCAPTELIVLVDAWEHAFGNYAKGRYAWITNFVFALTTPIPFRAQQGLFEVPAETVSEMRKQWREAA